MAEHQRYKITDRLDAGGMAEVFRGVAESLQGFKKNVAIKRILPHLTKNKKFISMFLDEARLSLHLQHANIVGVFDIGVSPPDGVNPGAYFIVMEFVDGANLKGVLDSLRRQGKRMRVAHTIYLMMEVCKGLAYAHEIGDPETSKPLNIVHRDISPPNILISKNGEVKLVDFGLAKATSQLENTDPGVVKGKFSYLSPEAALGKEVDKRADIFAVGVLLYELLSGKRLFYGETDYQTVELVRQARVPSLTQQNTEVDAELEAVVRKALAKDLNQRFQSAGELQDALAQYLFSRGLKVTSRDIATLIQECVRERQQSQPVAQQPKSLIDALIQEEMLKFTSLEQVAESQSAPGAQPITADDLGAKPLDAGSFIDPRTWGNEEQTLADVDLPARILATVKDPASAKASPLDTTAIGGGKNGQAAAVVPRVATPVEPKPAPRPKDPSLIEPLEHLLEGTEVGTNQVPATVGVRKPPPEKKGGKGFLFAILALVLATGGVVVYLYRAGLIAGLIGNK